MMIIIKTLIAITTITILLQPTIYIYNLIDILIYARMVLVVIVINVFMMIIITTLIAITTITIIAELL